MSNESYHDLPGVSSSMPTDTVIHVGLRQLGREGLQRLKAHIEHGKSLHFGGAYFSYNGVP